MTKRVCLEVGCPTLTEGRTRCPHHERTRDKARGTRQERGYDAAHDRLRAREDKRVAKGQVTCWRCEKRISALEEWDLGHCDDNRAIYHGPEHVACNRGARGSCPNSAHITTRIGVGGNP